MDRNKMRESAIEQLRVITESPRIGPGGEPVMVALPRETMIAVLTAAVAGLTTLDEASKLDPDARVTTYAAIIRDAFFGFQEATSALLVDLSPDEAEKVYSTRAVNTLAAAHSLTAFISALLVGWGVNPNTLQGLTTQGVVRYLKELEVPPHIVHRVLHCFPGCDGTPEPQPQPAKPCPQSNLCWRTLRSSGSAYTPCTRTSRASTAGCLRPQRTSLLRWSTAGTGGPWACAIGASPIVAPTTPSSSVTATWPFPTRRTCSSRRCCGCPMSCSCSGRRVTRPTSTKNASLVWRRPGESSLGYSPRVPSSPIKLGDLISRATAALGIPHCPSCERRRQALNKVNLDGAALEVAQGLIQAMIHPDADEQRYTVWSSTLTIRGKDKDEYLPQYSHLAWSKTAEYEDAFGQRRIRDLTCTFPNGETVVVSNVLKRTILIHAEEVISGS